MPQRILLIGSGAREHAVGWKLKESSTEVELCVWGGSRNPGLLGLAVDYKVGKMDDVAGIVAWAKEKKVDWAFVGPELPLSVGVVDALATVGIPAVGPMKAAAQVETSKSFLRALLVEAGIKAYPKFFVATEKSQIGAWVLEHGKEFVVKPDGLTGGKGVKVQGDHFASSDEGIAYAKECLEKDGRVILEEKLVGQEFSLMSFCDGKTLVHMPAVQDNKRLLPNDKGPNTGGMGSVSDEDHSLPFLKPGEILEAGDTNIDVIEALKARGIEYKGILYGNYMVTGEGLRLIEYNARFGDPEAMNVLSILETDLVDICQAIIGGTLESVPVKFAEKATVCKYVVPEGYPEKGVKDVCIEFSGRLGNSISSLRNSSRQGGTQTVLASEIESPALLPDGGRGVENSKVHVFYASVDQREDGLYLTGSRAIGVVGVDYTMKEAEAVCEAAVREIKGPVVHREDIGTKALMSQRAEMMKRLR